jgi:signal peptidase II|tara:strand:+ start:58 stop:540 length:483 start_codon:yes stop_codon:yes gene_type:complete
MMQMGPTRAGTLIALLTILFDQLSKWWILNVTMVPPRIIPVTSFFDLVLVHNRGASFGIFSDAPGWASIALIVFAILISIALAIWMWRVHETLLAVALALVIGGAVGNVIDRIRFGAVVDFLDFHVGGWHWPAFNIADSAITIGVILLILDSLKSKPENT